MKNILRDMSEDRIRRKTNSFKSWLSGGCIKWLAAIALSHPMGLTGLACEVNDIGRKPQEPPLIVNSRFLKPGGGQYSVTNFLLTIPCQLFDDDKRY